MGNYSDFERKVKDEVKIVEKKVIKQEKQVKVKMTFNEKKEYETIEDEIMNIEKQINDLNEIINNSYMNYALVRDEIEKKEQFF